MPIFLQIRLFVSAIDTFQVTNTSQGSDTVIVTLTLSPPDYRIHTVYCSITQADFRIGVPVKIEIFPYDEANGMDWEFSNTLLRIVQIFTSEAASTVRTKLVSCFTQVF